MSYSGMYSSTGRSGRPFGLQLLCRDAEARYLLEDSARSWQAQASKLALLTGEEEVRLAALARAGCQVARTRMIEANLRLVVSIARRYRSSGMSFSDLIQEGNVGLIHAVERFDELKGCRFSTFATCWVRQAILRALSEQSRLVRLPENIVDLLRKRSQAQERLRARLGREPSLDDVAHELGVPPARLSGLMPLDRAAYSIDRPNLDPGRTSWADSLSDPRSSVAYDAAVNGVLRSVLERAMQRLSSREETVLRLRYGLVDGTPWTLERIAGHLGLTRERVRQIEGVALHKLKRRDLHAQVT